MNIDDGLPAREAPVQAGGTSAAMPAAGMAAAVLGFDIAQLLRQAIRGPDGRRPAGWSVESVRPIRDDIRDRAGKLLADLTITA